MCHAKMSSRLFDSLTQAVEVYYDELRVYVQQRTGSVSIAEDVVQETWLRASEHNQLMPDNPRAYLYRVASNLTIDYLRKQKLIDPIEISDHAVNEETYAQHWISNQPGPEQIHAAREELAILIRAVEGLPEKCRQVFLLHRGNGLTMKQVAQQLAISEKTVEKHIAKAMIHCRHQLKLAEKS